MRKNNYINFIIFSFSLTAVVIFIFFYFLFSVEAEDTTHSRIETFTSNGSLVVPSGVTSITFEAWGGGGGGTTNTGAGGGGAYMKKVHSVSAGQTYVVTVGSGGTAGGNNGATSSVALFGGGAVLVAPPGLGGGSPGGGEGGLASNGTGDSGFDGGNGSQGTGTRAGGGGAGNSENGSNGGASSIGKGGTAFGGAAPSNASSNSHHYSSGGGSAASAQRDGTQGVVMATYDLDVGSGYPVIKSRGFGHNAGNNFRHPITMPSGVQIGDLILIFLATDGVPTFTIPTGWTQLIRDNNATSVSTGAAFYSYATTTSPALEILDSFGEVSSHTTLRIANYNTTYDPVAASASGFSANANPPSLDTGTSTINYLWIAAVSRDGSAFGSVSAPPTGYTDFTFVVNSDVQANTNEAGVATMHSTASSEDPGTFTNESQEWVALTIAVPGPEVSDPGDPTTSTETVKTLIKGGTTIKGGVTFQIFLPVFRFFETFLPRLSFLSFLQFDL